MKLSPITLPSRPKGLRFDVQAVADPRFEVNAQGDPATISVFDSIDAGFSARIAGALRQIGPKPVLLEINSRGGDFFEAIGAFNLLVRHPAAITAQIVGIAASAASVLAMAGERIEIFKSARLMVHNAQGVVIGNRHDMVEFAATLETLDGTMQSIYAKRTGLGEAEVGRLMDDETFIDSDEAKALGFVDAVLDQDGVPAPDVTAGAAPNSKAELESRFRAMGLSRSAAGRAAGAAWATMRGAGADRAGDDLDLDAVARALNRNFAALSPYLSH